MTNTKSNHLGNDFSSRALGPVTVPSPIRGPSVARKTVTRVDGRKASVLVVDFSQINTLALHSYVEGN
jgi:hypothetical protein